jgi:hypothetical protein
MVGEIISEWVGDIIPESWTTSSGFSALERAFDVPESVGDAEHRIQTISGLWMYHSMRGNCRTALPVAQKLRAVSGHNTNSAGARLGDWLTSITLHYQGEQTAARRLLEHGAASDGPTDAVLARILWLQGCPEQALGLITRGIERATAAQRIDWLCAKLSVAACPLALRAGDLTAFERHLRDFTKIADRSSFESWRLRAQCFNAIVRMKRGDRVNFSTFSGSAVTSSVRSASGEIFSWSS